MEAHIIFMISTAIYLGSSYMTCYRIIDMGELSMRRNRITICILIIVLSVFVLKNLYIKYVFYEIKKENSEHIKSLLLNKDDINEIAEITDSLYKKRNVNTIGIMDGKFALFTEVNGVAPIEIDNEIKGYYDNLNNILSNYSFIGWIYKDENNTVIFMPDSTDSTGNFYYRKGIVVSALNNENTLINYYAIPGVKYKEIHDGEKIIWKRRSFVTKDVITIKRIESNIFMIEEESRINILRIFVE